MGGASVPMDSGPTSCSRPAQSQTCSNSLIWSGFPIPRCCPPAAHPVQDPTLPSGWDPIPPSVAAAHRAVPDPWVLAASFSPDLGRSGRLGTHAAPGGPDSDAGGGDSRAGLPVTPLAPKPSRLVGWTPPHPPKQPDGKGAQPEFTATQAPTHWQTALPKESVTLFVGLYPLSLLGPTEPHALGPEDPAEPGKWARGP